jgi:dipeptidase E
MDRDAIDSERTHHAGQRTVASMPAELFLMSSSRVFGGGYLDYAREALLDFLGDARTLYFAPFATADHDAYTRDVATALAPHGIDMVGLHTLDARLALESAAALFVGGGNSFRLLKRLHELELIETVRRRVAAGELRYVGSSAGSNMACPTLRTTNDMPIVQPLSFDAFNLVPFQINPHYVDADANSTHMGETRETRLREFLEENDVVVVGLREGAYLRRSGDRLTLDGVAGARLFQRGIEPSDLRPPADLSWLLQASPRFDRSPIHDH